MEKQQFWPPEHHTADLGVYLELRAELALQFLMQRVITVDSSVDDDDSLDAVNRAFALADAFVDRASERGELKPSTLEDLKRAFSLGGELMALRDQSRSDHQQKQLDELRELVTRFTDAGKPDEAAGA